MRTVATTLVLLTFACTNDYDQFNFGGAPATGGTSNTGGTTVNTGGGGGTTDGGAPSTGGMGNGGTPSTGGMGNGGAPTTGGMGQGGGGGAPPTDVTVPCGAAVTPCDVDAGQSCCIDNNGASAGNCSGNCQGNQATLDCNEPADCPGQRCCLEAGGGDVSFSRCEDSCGDETICDPANPDCGGGETCDQHPDMPPGYFYCN
ncbi:MAG: hypothetical protein IPM79_21775 [Polyangiaceae bacterium]|jgi:hypothetical protein|nr:hypothetical protein [Polyangiaceae bacterium]MBK8940174.1 hypothetical protein [Polyangiaceae bacterium]